MMLPCLLLFLSCVGLAHGFTAIAPKLTPQPNHGNVSTASATTYSFCVPLAKERPKAESFAATLVELWNDPRPVSSLIANKDPSNAGERGDRPGGGIPYCIASDNFTVAEEPFQILLYPRGKLAQDDAGAIAGPAAAYLRYLGNYGDEVDVAWKLRLCRTAADGDGREPLAVGASGGLPRSNTTWSAAMTFCAEAEAVDSVGRTADWGSSGWSAHEVCDALRGGLVAEGDVTVFERRRGGSSFSWPPLRKGAAGAVYRAATRSPGAQNVPLQCDYRVGEVIVPRLAPGWEADIETLKQTFVYPGIDYRIMTMSDKDGTPIFSTECLEDAHDKGRARLALRPCGWKTQQQLWAKNGKTNEWPVEVEARLLSQVTTTRFNRDSVAPRIVSAFQRDRVAYSLALALALAPIPLTLFGECASLLVLLV